MKFLYKTTLVTSALLTCLPAVQAEEPLTTSANVALTSDYVYRGKTQTDEGIAIQGGFDIFHESGIYVGTWASNVNFLEDSSIAPEDRANMEVDVYVGLSGVLTEELSYDVKIGQYMYPGASSDLEYDLTEFNLTLTYAMPQGTEIGLVYDYSPDFGGLDNAHHYLLSMDHPLSNGLGIGGYVAQQNIDEGDDYFYYGMSVSFPIANLDASLAYSNTDLDNAGDFGADDRVFFTLSKSF
ncbi:TorF family putative porin [Candidatus Halobeggiatoa sp. HSG11]|nr:TorF family putative porin [Candidatus Halobeggiatoa sp. HSG11]